MRAKKSAIACKENIDKSSNDDELSFWYRTTIRSFISYVEGITYNMRYIIIRSHIRNDINLLDKELYVIKEKSYYFQGKIKERDNYNSMCDNVFLSFKYFTVILMSNYQLNKSDHKYDSFKKIIQYRNKITHPKTINEYDFNPDIIDYTKEGITWFYQSLKDLLDSQKALEDVRNRTILRK